MKLLVQLNANNTGINAVEIVNNTFTTSEPGEYVYEVDNDAVVNKILNDYENVEVTFPAGKLKLTPTGTVEEANARKSDLTEWKKRVRPALMRAATTTHLFNA